MMFNSLSQRLRLNSRKYYINNRITDKYYETKAFIENIKKVIDNSIIPLRLIQILIKNIFLKKVMKKVLLQAGKYSKSLITDKPQHKMIVNHLICKKPIVQPKNNFNNLKGFSYSHKYDEISKNKLPIHDSFFPLMKAIDVFDILIIIAETGAGKTTQLPKFLHIAGYTTLGCLCITQPRRIAAINISKRLCTETEKTLGMEIGYSVRFEDMTSINTIIKFLTDGILLREILSNPLLDNYSVLILDEAHERTLYTDVLLALTRDLVIFRKDLKLIISSATINTSKFSKFFYNAPLFQIPGRVFSVGIFYCKESELDYLDSVVKTIFHIHLRTKTGDILTFLTGQEDIEITESIMNKRKNLALDTFNKLIIFPLYSTLSYESQNKVFLPSPKETRKIILSTNIAETSLTINGIIFVIDSGLCKLKYFDPMYKSESLIVTPISKSSSWQRSGRAGRVSHGLCFRLYTMETYKFILKKSHTPEIKRSDIDGIILSLKSLGINDIINFEFLDYPSLENLFFSLENLFLLGAINNDGKLSKLGRIMNEIPLHPRLSKVLISSPLFDCFEEVAILCSILSLESRLFNYSSQHLAQIKQIQNKFSINPKSDHICLLNAFKEWIAMDFSIKWAELHSLNVSYLKKR
mmetsp:Transcript_19012/g.46689  ORF Transcript_19012/g.46689 Transcript_19012/m.46689 type:complete len:638 (+) Transcript_19012:149-2062(+)